MKEEETEGVKLPNTDRDAELALSLHRNLNWAGRERSRHAIREEARLHVSTKVEAQKRKHEAAGSQSDSQDGTGEEEVDRVPRKKSRGPTSPTSGSGRAAKAPPSRPLSLSTLTAAVAQALSKASHPGPASADWHIVKCFVAGSRWGRLVPRDALTTRASLLNALRGGMGKDRVPSLARAGIIIVTKSAKCLEFGPDEAGQAADERWAAACAKAVRVYVQAT